VNPVIGFTDTKGNNMGSQVDKTKGKIKQAVGDLTGNKDLQRQGKADERSGKAKKVVEDLKDNANAAIDKATAKFGNH
jgi:uncharacterized protein YjbJ (UPF0337 family)